MKISFWDIISSVGYSKLETILILINLTVLALSLFIVFLAYKKIKRSSKRRFSNNIRNNHKLEGIVVDILKKEERIINEIKDHWHIKEIIIIACVYISIVLNIAWVVLQLTKNMVGIISFHSQPSEQLIRFAVYFTLFPVAISLICFLVVFFIVAIINIKLKKLMYTDYRNIT